MIHNRHCGYGQSTIEYGLIGGLVLCVCIYPLTLLGQTLGTGFGNMIGHSEPKATNSSTAPGSGGSPAGQSTFHSPDTLQITTADGRKINLNIPNNVPVSIMTAGANGTTTMLAQSMEALAKQLLTEGKIDQAGADALVKLANLTHGIARIESVVETTMQNAGGNANAALSAPIEFEGRTYNSVSELTDLIKTGQQNPDGSYPMGSKMTELFNAYSQLWPAGVMKDPQVSAILDVYVHEAASIADSNRVIVDQMHNGFGSPDQFRTQLSSQMSKVGYHDTAKLLAEKSGSSVTHTDAAQICTTGNNTDSGTSCQP